MAFIHNHPYPPFLFPEVKKLIVGTLPPPRFSQGRLKPRDVDFCYGSSDGQLWPILDRLFQLDLEYAPTAGAVMQRKRFLKRRGIGICDIVARARRETIDASDQGMHSVELRDILQVLHDYPRVEQLLFTGGNSKNGPEYFFRRLLRENEMQLQQVRSDIPRIHTFDLPLPKGGYRRIHTVSLTAPSGAANRAVGSMAAYKARKARDPNYSTLDFRAEQYRQFF
jgi:G:T/U-mismatch repair DNA glycosylase